MIVIGKAGGSKIHQYKKINKFHMDFKNIGVDFHSIYAKDNYIPTKISRMRDEECLARNPLGNPRITRHKKCKEKKISFPESFRRISKSKKNRKKSKDNPEKKKFYSLSRQLLAGRFSKKLDEFSKGDKKHQSQSFSRSFRRKNSEGGRRRENNSFVLERRYSKERRVLSTDISKITK